MTQLEKLMKLGMSEDEARQVMEDDKKIDKGEKMDFDLSREEEKATRKYRQADRNKTAYKFTPRERKPNEAKRELIQWFYDLLHDVASERDLKNLEVTNIERQIDFELDGVRYRIVLSAPRK